MQYPTPLAPIRVFLIAEDQERIESSYEGALFADLRRLLAAVSHSELAVQWDVAVEIQELETDPDDTQTFDHIIKRLARCVARVPSDVPAGIHLCYGDHQHRHFKEPESLELQVRVANALSSAADRPVNWYAFTVPQYQRDLTFFTPLRNLRAGDETEVYFSLVPYHPAQQEPGTTGKQVRIIDGHLGPQP